VQAFDFPCCWTAALLAYPDGNPFFSFFRERERAMGIPVWAFLLFLDNGKNSGFKPL